MRCANGSLRPDIVLQSCPFFSSERQTINQGSIVIDRETLTGMAPKGAVVKTLMVYPIPASLCLSRLYLFNKIVILSSFEWPAPSSRSFSQSWAACFYLVHVAYIIQIIIRLMQFITKLRWALKEWYDKFFNITANPSFLLLVLFSTNTLF